jgi:hypothetical protein
MLVPPGEFRVMTRQTVRSANYPALGIDQIGVSFSSLLYCNAGCQYPCKANPIGMSHVCFVVYALNISRIACCGLLVLRGSSLFLADRVIRTRLEL